MRNRRTPIRRRRVTKMQFAGAVVVILVLAYVAYRVAMFFSMLSAGIGQLPG